MKKTQNDRRRLLLNKDIVRALASRDLTEVAGGVGSSEKSISISGCPACTEPF